DGDGAQCGPVDAEVGGLVEGGGVGQGRPSVAVRGDLPVDALAVVGAGEGVVVGDPLGDGDLCAGVGAVDGRGDGGLDGLDFSFCRWRCFFVPPGSEYARRTAICNL